MREAHIKTNYDYACELCDKKYSKKCSLENHFKAEHEMSNDFMCTLCNKVCSEKFDLKRHIKKVHEMENATEKKPEMNVAIIQERIKCDICEKMFNKSSLKRHVEENHSRIKNIDCGFCCKAFYSQNNLNRHIQTVHKNKNIL